MKLLFIENVGRKVGNFSYSSILAALELGWEFHIAAKWTGYAGPEEKKMDEEKYGIKIHDIDFIRKPYDIRNIKAYKQVCKLIRQEKIDIIHCNTPIGGVVGRLAGRRCKVRTVIYQAHGFHFYKGAPLFNWLVYYPIEKWLAHFTDVLITINHEDFRLAKEKMHLRGNGRICHVPGVGIDLTLFENERIRRVEKREELKLDQDDVMILSMGDLIARKNYAASIRAVATAKNAKIHYFICGAGQEEQSLKDLADRLDVAGNVHFMGYRTDIRELLNAADIFLFTTRQEGLPRAMMEAMASGLPCIASRIRGNTDLLEDGEGGYLCGTDDIADYAKKINLLAENPELRKKMGINNLARITEFGINNVQKDVQSIYTYITNMRKR